MKVIVSHDVDHISFLEHWKDMIIPKFIIRTIIETVLGIISIKECFLRFYYSMRNQWNNIDDLMEFDRKHKIPSTFYIGVAKGLGLSYSHKRAVYWIRRVLNKGFRVGVHGIAFDDYTQMKNEHRLFSELSGLQDFGIRMHYLRHSSNTLVWLAELGYLYTASVRGSEITAIGDFYSFPVQVMDSDLMNSKRTRWQRKDFNAIQKTTIQLIEKAENENQPFLSVIFHDRYFGPDFMMWKKWYVWLIEYIKNQNICFCTYEEAIKEIRANDNDYKIV